MIHMLTKFPFIIKYHNFLGIWNTSDIVMRNIFPSNQLAQILVPYGFSLPILVILGAYSTATFRGVARSPDDNYTLFLVVYEHPIVVLYEMFVKLDKAVQSFRGNNQ